METPYASLDRPQQHATEQLNEICLDTPTNRPRSVCFGFGFSKPTDFWVKSRKTDRDNFHVRFTTLALTQFMRGSHCTCFFLNSLLVFKCKTPSSCNRATASTSTTSSSSLSPRIPSESNIVEHLQLAVSSKPTKKSKFARRKATYRHKQLVMHEGSAFLYYPSLYDAELFFHLEHSTAQLATHETSKNVRADQSATTQPVCRLASSARCIVSTTKKS